MINLDSMESVLFSNSSVKEFQELYGIEPDIILQQQKRYLNLSRKFREQFPRQERVAFFSTPGRTEVGGNHTDHQHGRVLCAAVNLDILAVAAPNQENVIRLKSEGFSYMDVVELTSLEPVEQEKEKSASLIRGIAAAFLQRGHQIGGLDIYTCSKVPKGSGLSSSAAFEVLVATVLNTIYNNKSLNALELAMISQYAENVYFGKPSGLMDQCGCSVGGFISIDFGRPDAPMVKPIHIHFEESGYSLVITHTGGSHSDLTGDYASIPTDMREVSGKFGKEVLRDVSESVFWQSLPELRRSVNDRALLRAMHFFADNARVSEQVDALENHDFSRFLSLVNQSGLSSWTQLQNIWSIKEPLEQPLALALALSARLLGRQGACRVHGGGFAGTIQAFVPIDMIDNYILEMGKVFGTDSVIQLQIRNRSSCEVELL